MRISRLLLVLTAALGACAKAGPQYVQYQYVPAPQAAAAPTAPPPGYQAQAAYQVPVPAPGYQAPVAQSYPAVRATPMARAPAPRGLLSQGGPLMRPPTYRQPVYPSPCGPQGCGAAAMPAYGYAQPFFETPYLLDAGDRLRITIFGQEGLTNSYAVDAAGNITMPLVGTVPARGMTTEQLSYSLTERLKQGYIREPKVAIEVEAYRPFFIHGEVATPGQYAYVANMTVENAIAIAGGFGPRADRGKVTVSRTIGGQTSRATVGLAHPLRPGDTLRVGERWF